MSLIFPSGVSALIEGPAILDGLESRLLMRAPFLALAFCAGGTLARAVLSVSPPPVIVQLFDWKFADIQRALPRLRETGYTHLHVSPVQLSVENGKWWGKYQPIDYRVIEGPLGDRAELCRLAAAADELGVELIVDVVLNHMAAGDRVRVVKGELVEARFPDFQKEDFHPFRPIEDWEDEEEVRNHWLFGALPDLKTESPTVRAKLVAHLRDLQSCGVKGFRIDSARHIAPTDLQAICGEVQIAGLLVGEIAEDLREVFEPFLETVEGMRYFDFPAQVQLAACLRGERPLQDLTRQDKATSLPVSAAVSLVRNHDIDRGEAVASEGLNDEKYLIPHRLEQVAHLCLFGRDGGIPYVYVADPLAKGKQFGYEVLDRPYLAPAIAFYRATHEQQTASLYADRDLAVWQRGEAHLVLINIGEKDAVLRSLQTTLTPGVYQDVFSEVTIEVRDRGLVGEIPLKAARGYAFERMP